MGHGAVHLHGGRGRQVTLSRLPAPAAALPVARYVEFLTPAPYIDSLLVQPFELDAEGFLTIPDRPGLGIELDRDVLARFSG